jgi:hypothetical protein
VINPADKLIMNVEIKRHTAKSQPSVATLKKKISGSIEGDATQKAITGANGTPLISRAAIMGITPQEQNGLNAPTTVANRIAVIGLNCITFFMCLETPDNCTRTANGIVSTK